jgi:probable HAF family extracellular repeat protein
MALVDRTGIGRYGIAAIAAGVFTALAAASSGPAWGQETGDPAAAPAASQAETMGPAAMMQMMMGGSGDSGDTAPLTGHGFLLDRDVFTTLDAQGAVHAFLLNKRFGSLREGVFTTIDHPDAASAPGLGTAAFGINDRGRIVGTYIDAGGRAHGFLRDKGHGALREKGAFTAIDHPDGALATVASGINNRGQIVGGYQDSEGTAHGFLLDEGNFTTIDHPDAASGRDLGTVLWGINNRGQIVGQYIDTDLRCHGLLLTNDTFTTIDDPGALSYTGAVDVNDRGQIVGFSDSRTGLTACFAEASTSASDPGSTDK